MKKIILIFAIGIFTGCVTNKDIRNSEDAEFVEEVAFNLDVPAKKVTQKQFNLRYK